jgi:hypothetical protein
VFGKAPPSAVKASVGMMLGGAVVAAASDLSFHPVGYGLVLANGTHVRLQLHRTDLKHAC